jgi:DNA-binding MarR family transcriptional regulator
VAFARGIWLEIFAVNQLLGAAIARSLDEDPAAREFALYSTLAGLGEATPTQVSALLGLPLSTASAQLNRLVARGHAIRETNAADGRSFVFALTDEGRRATTAHFEAFGAMARRVRARLNLPESAIREGLADLEQALRAELELLEREDD